MIHVPVFKCTTISIILIILKFGNVHKLVYLKKTTLNSWCHTFHCPIQIRASGKLFEFLIVMLTCYLNMPVLTLNTVEDIGRSAN